MTGPDPVAAPGAADFTLRPIGHVDGGRIEPEDDFWGGVQAGLRLDPARVSAESITGLEAFSHLEVVYLFHLVEEGSEEMTARRPRNNPQWPQVGIYAQRAKRRPNRLGVSRCRLLGIDGLLLHVEGLDAVDGTPILDIKPWMEEFAPIGQTSQPAWSTELMTDYYTEQPSE